MFAAPAMSISSIGAAAVCGIVPIMLDIDPKAEARKEAGRRRAREYQRRKAAEIKLLPEGEQAVIRAKKLAKYKAWREDNLDRAREIAASSNKRRRRAKAEVEGREFGRIGIEIAASPEDKAARKEARKAKKSEYDKARYASIRDNKIATAKASYERNKDAALAASKQRYEANRDEILAQQADKRRKRIADDPSYREVERARSRAAYAANPEKHKESSRRSTAARKERDPEYMARYQRERYWKDPEKARARGVMDAANRRARKLAAGGDIPVDAVAILFGRQKGKCVFCLKPFGKAKPHIDHYVALSRGGTNDMSNLRLLHRECNMRKHAKHPIDFALKNGLLCW